jgi:hypothetical protein
VKEEPEQNEYWNRHSQQPEKCISHERLLPADCLPICATVVRKSCSHLDTDAALARSAGATGAE